MAKYPSPPRIPPPRFRHIIKFIRPMSLKLFYPLETKVNSSRHRMSHTAPDWLLGTPSLKNVEHTAVAVRNHRHNVSDT
jgi:hypothetical protein